MYRRIQFTFLLMIFLALLSEPFVFSQIDFVGREIRAFVGITVLLLLFLEKNKFRFSEILVYLILVIIILFEATLQRSPLNNVISGYVVILIAFSLFIILKEDNLKFNLLLKLWLIFSLIANLPKKYFNCSKRRSEQIKTSCRVVFT